MPVHNALPHLDEAIESILAQTFSAFEFVILDDASTDGSTERLRDWAKRDQRIRLIEVTTNLGPVHSSNRVANEAAAPIVARMDADDISHPERMAEQMKVLSEHPEVGVVASVCDMVGPAGEKMRDPELWRLSRRSPFVPFPHGAMMYRRDLFDRVGGYRDECEYWEDQDLVVRMAAVSEVVVIPRSLYCVRQSPTSTRAVSSQDRMEQALNRMYESADRLLEGRDYDVPFEEQERAGAKLDPRVFIALGSVRLWAGGKPKLLRRLLSRGDLALNMRSATALVWTAWASTSPSSLRRFLLLLLRARNRFASSGQTDAAPISWRPVEGAQVRVRK